MFVNICHSIDWEVQSLSRDPAWGFQVSTAVVGGGGVHMTVELLVLHCGLYFARLSDEIDQTEEIVVFNMLYCHTRSGIFTGRHIKCVAGESPSVSLLSLSLLSD